MDIVLRVLIIYLFVLCALRLIGKREFGQLSPMELISIMLIPELVSQALTREDFSLTTAIVGVSTLLLLVLGTSVLTKRSKKLEQIIEGTPALLVANGRLLTEVLDRERITTEELFAEMHRSGLSSLEEVKWAILEGDGKIGFIPVDPARRGLRPSEDPVL